MKYKYFLTFLFFSTIGIYLFATAPQPLVADNKLARKIPIEVVLDMINQEHEVVRSVYTKRIVKPGKRVGLKFDERWKDKNINAGPLPAQFLRLTAVGLEKSKLPLGLFLGSDYPISTENQLTGIQQQEFMVVKKTRTPRFFYVNDIRRYTLLVPDIAVSDVCVSCHNKHKDSSKSDWVINDVMGAVTWTYPEKSVDIEKAVALLSVFRKSVLGAYSRYVDKVRAFDKPPAIGQNWPKAGYFLPTPAVFMRAISQQASPLSIRALNKMSEIGFSANNLQSNNLQTNKEQ